jgi:hypothetical protein
MTPRMRQVGLSAMLVSALLATAQAAEVPREMHGSADTFSAPGMALAWGVLRGTDDERTVVVIRIIADPAVFAEASATGSDPFTGQRRDVLSPTKITGSIDLRLPRAHFAAFPRTELRFRPPTSANGTAPVLVFYLGVPDTTPEFVDEAKLDAYLRARLTEMRGSKTP